MANTTTLESLAKLLPPEERERFPIIASRLNDIPDDDEHFQMLDGIGLIMLMIKGAPNEIVRILEQALEKLGETETEQLRSEIGAVLTYSLDTPSYKDLRETMLAMRDYEERFRQKVDGLYKRLAASEGAIKGSKTLAPILWGGLTAGVIVATAALVMYGLPLVAPSEPVPLPEKLRPFAALLAKGQLDYFEMDMPKRGQVGMYLIGGGAEEAFIDGSHGVVVRPLDNVATE